MKRSRTKPPQANKILETLLRHGPDAPDLETKLSLLTHLRTTEPATGPLADQMLLNKVDQTNHALDEVAKAQEKMRRQVQKMASPPWFPATFHRRVDTPHGSRALVAQGRHERLVELSEDLEFEDLQMGDEVYLSQELNVLMAHSAMAMTRGGETAVFERRMDDGRLVLKSRDEHIIVSPAGRECPVNDLLVGDVVRYDRTLWMAFDKVDRPKDEHPFLLEEIPEMNPDQVGGQEKNMEKLIGALTAVLTDANKASQYGLNGRQSILMIGPPGGGKTLMTRVAASEIGRLSGKKCRFAVVRPAEWEDPYVGVTEQNIRGFFRATREAAKDCLVVVFLDEIEAVGRIRGTGHSHHSDKFLAAFLAELDGFEERKNVAIISATNRKDLVDPALLERVSDIEISVARPNMDAARAILGIHLPATLLYSPNGAEAPATRDDAIETAVSSLYSPNGDNAVARIRFSDGKDRVVTARELISGRVLEQIARAARRTAFQRDIATAEGGIQPTDLGDAVHEAVQRMRTTLSIHNAHAYLPDLPQDVNVVSVEPVRDAAEKSPSRYLNR